VYLCLVLVVQENVGRLDVAMDDARVACRARKAGEAEASKGRILTTRTSHGTTPTPCPASQAGSMQDLRDSAGPEVGSFLAACWDESARDLQSSCKYARPLAAPMAHFMRRLQLMTGRPLPAWSADSSVPLGTYSYTSRRWSRAMQ